MKTTKLIFCPAYLCLLAFCIIVSCKPGHEKFSEAEKTFVKNSVDNLTKNIADDVSKKGPRAWLNYFEDANGFFMANQGKISFEDYRAAKMFILNNLVKNVRRIKLKWNNVRVDPLGPDLASMGAGFHEDITDMSGKTISVDGYFTGLAHYDGIKWKLRNLHWSTPAAIN